MPKAENKLLRSPDPVSSCSRVPATANGAISPMKGLPQSGNSLAEMIACAREPLRPRRPPSSRWRASRAGRLLREPRVGRACLAGPTTNVRVVIASPTTRSDPWPNGITTPAFQFGTAVWNVGGSAGLQFSCSSLNVNPYAIGVLPSPASQTELGRLIRGERWTGWSGAVNPFSIRRGTVVDIEAIARLIASMSPDGLASPELGRAADRQAPWVFRSGAQHPLRGSSSG